MTECEYNPPKSTTCDDCSGRSTPLSAPLKRGRNIKKSPRWRGERGMRGTSRGSSLYWFFNPLTDKLNINIFYENFCLCYIESWEEIMWSRHITYCYSITPWMKIADRPTIWSLHDGASFVSRKCLPNKRIREGEYREGIGKSSDKINTTTIETNHMSTFWCNECKDFEWDNSSEIHDIWRKLFQPYFSKYAVLWSIHQENGFFWKFFCYARYNFLPCIDGEWSGGICTEKD